MKINKFKKSAIIVKLYEEEINDLKTFSNEKKMSLNDYVIKIIIDRIHQEKWHKEQLEITKLNKSLNIFKN